MISLCVCAFNEAWRILPLLESVRGYCGEVVLSDHSSTDNTAQVVKTWCMASGTKLVVLTEPRTERFCEPIRQRGFDAATGEWILCMDADETLDRSALPDIEQADCWNLSRLTMLSDGVAQPTQFWWEYHLRLFRRGMAIQPVEMHTGPRAVDGKTDVNMPGVRPAILHLKHFGEQLYRDKQRGQRPDEPWPIEWMRSVGKEIPT